MKACLAACLLLVAFGAPLVRAADDAPPAVAETAGPVVPDRVDTRIGALRFFDGFPDSVTIKATYDYLDFMRGMRIYRETMPAAAQMAFRDALRNGGAANGAMAFVEHSGAGTAEEAQAPRALGWLDLRKGPLVVEVVPEVVLTLNDGWGRAIIVAEEAGNGGPSKLLVLPPGYKGKVPAAYRGIPSRTHGLSLRALPAILDGDPVAAMAQLRAGLHVYPLALAVKPPRTRWVNFTGKAMAAPVPSKRFDVIDRLVQEEPAEALDAEMVLLLDAIGIRKGQRFRPDGRTKAMIADAIEVSEATARTIKVATREKVAEEPVDSARVAPATQGPAETLDTRIGKLTFEGGMPTPDATRLVFDHLDFMNGVEVYLAAQGAAASAAWQAGLGELGIANGTLGIFENAMDSRALVVTGDTEAIYVLGYLDLSAGPMVVETPLNMQGEIRTAWWRTLTAFGVTGPDKGKGGRYLILPPGYAGDVPAKGYQVVRSPTFGNVMWWRGFRLKGDPEPAIDNTRRNIRVYPLAESRPTQGEFVSLTGRDLNLLASTGLRFYEQVARVVEREDAESLEPAMRRVLGAIGMAKGEAFAPDERLKAILEEAAAVGDATARSIVFASRFPEAFPWPRSQWQASEFGAKGVGGQAHALEAQVRDVYFVEGFAAAMALRGEASGMQSALVFRDARGEGFDGGRSYRLRLPARIPAQLGWSLVPYDNRARSMLRTDERYPGIGNRRRGLLRNPDGSIDVWFGPQAPAGKSVNWVQTLPDKGWSLVLRLYGATEAWYAKAWRPGEVEPMK